MEEKKKHPKSVQIRCTETGVVYRSIMEASMALGLDFANLARIVRKAPGHKSIKGLHFEKVTTETSSV